MAKTLKYNVSNPTANIAPTGLTPGPLFTAYGITDYSGTVGTNASGQFYTGDANSTQAIVQFTNAPSGGAALPAIASGRFEVDAFIAPGSPVSGTTGDIFLYLNATAGAPGNGGYVLAFDERSTVNNCVGLGIQGNGGYATSKNVHTWTTWANIRLALEVFDAGTGPSGNHFAYLYFEILDLSNSLALIQSGTALVDSRYYECNFGANLPTGGAAAIAGSYPSFNTVSIYEFDSSGPFAIVRDIWSDWQSKDVIRLIGAVPMGGTAPYSYQWQYRVHGSSTWLNVSTTAPMTGHNPCTVVQGLSPSTSYDFQRITTDSAAGSITSATVTVSTLAAGAASYAPIHGGDSITIGQGGTGQGYDRATAQFTALANVGIQHPSIPINLGISGADANLFSNMDATIAQLINELHPDALDTMLGTNDAGHGPPGDTGTVFQGHIDTIRAAVNGATPPTRVVFHGAPGRAIETPVSATTQDNVLLSNDYITAINNLCTAHPSLCYRGQTAYFAESLANWISGSFTYWNDTIHPSALGDARQALDEVTRLQSIMPGWYAPVVDAITIAPTGGQLEVGMVRDFRLHATLSGSPSVGIIIAVASSNTGVFTANVVNVSTDGSGNASIILTATGTVGNTANLTVSNGSYSLIIPVSIVAAISGGGGGGNTYHGISGPIFSKLYYS